MNPIDKYRNNEVKNEPAICVFEAIALLILATVAFTPIVLLVIK